MASDQLAFLLQAMRSDADLLGMMRNCLDVDDAVDLANGAGYRVERLDLLTTEARLAFDTLQGHGALRRNRATQFRQRYD